MSWDKVLNILFKFIPFLLSGTGIWQFFSGGAWFGQIIFISFCSSRSLHLLETPESAEAAFQSFGTGLLIGGIEGLLTPWLILVGVILIGSMAHMLFHIRARERFGNQINSSNKVWAFYTRYYFQITTAVAVAIPASMFLAPKPFLLGSIFVVFAVSSAVYLISFSKDLLDGKLMERLTYLALLITLLSACVIFPAQYGRQFFDVELRTAQPTAGSDLKLGRFETAFLINLDKQLFGRIRWFKDTWALEIVEEERLEPKQELISLREVADSLLPPNGEDAAEQAIAKLSEQLREVY